RAGADEVRRLGHRVRRRPERVQDRAHRAKLTRRTVAEKPRARDPEVVRVGDVVASDFEIEELAGSGGMGRVYRARDRRSGRYVGIKVMGGDGAREPKRFAREARALVDLAHPGIVRYVAHGTTRDGEAYLVMEWLEGESLRMRLARSTLTVVDA